MRKIYIDMDSLLDTRLGVLSRLSSDGTRNVFNNNNYWDRENEDWSQLTQGVITQEVFETAWKNRDTHDLKLSRMTGIVAVIKSILGEYNRAKRDEFIDYSIALEINVHPYELTAEEMDVLTGILKEDILQEDFTVLFVSIPLEELTLKYIDDQYSAVILYSFHHWIKTHCYELSHQSIKDVTMIVPRIFEHDVSGLTIEQKKEQVLGFKLWLMQHISLEFIDSRWFSILRPDIREPYEKDPPSE